jgi:hypothetical protein
MLQRAIRTGLLLGGVIALSLVSTAGATDGSAVITGHTNTSSSTTTITSTTTGSALSGISTTSGIGVQGSGDFAGVEGEGQAGVYGISGGTFAGETAQTGLTGVVGFGNDTGAFFEGVDGGVIATSDEGVGGAFSGDGLGVSADGQTGISATGGHTGISTTAPVALNATGEVQFSTAGLATVAKGKTSVTVNPGVDIDQASKVLVTPQSGGGTFARVGRNFAADTITLNLTGKATAPVALAYFIIS